MKNAFGNLIGINLNMQIALYTIVVLAILLKLGSAVVEPMGMSKISNFLNQISKLMFYLVGILLVVSFMYVLTLGLIMCLANGF